jgi:hypothetical protein
MDTVIGRKAFGMLQTPLLHIFLMLQTRAQVFACGRETLLVHLLLRFSGPLRAHVFHLLTHLSECDFSGRLRRLGANRGEGLPPTL